MTSHEELHMAVKRLLDAYENGTRQELTRAFMYVREIVEEIDNQNAVGPLMKTDTDGLSVPVPF